MLFCWVIEHGLGIKIAIQQRIEYKPYGIEYGSESSHLHTPGTCHGAQSLF